MSNPKFEDELPILRPHRLTARTRIALTYAMLLTVAGAVMLAIVIIFIGLVPNYEFATPLTPANPTEVTASPTPQNDLAPDATIPAETTDSLVVRSQDDVLVLLLIVTGCVLVLLAGGGIWAGWFVAGRMLRPLRHIDAAARRAARGQFDHRIALKGPRDELTELADTFDGMLCKLEKSFESYRRFAANASHELRTPLATTRAMLDVALATAEEEQKPLLTRLRSVNERSVNTVEALLDLSEIDSIAVAMEPVELSRIVSGVLDGVKAEAAAASITIDSALTTATVDGNSLLLHQLAQNIIQNAIRHNEPGGRILVSLQPGNDGTTVLEVTNDGETVPNELIQRLAEPFFRPAGRTSQASNIGRGLGLSIVTAIVDRHGATLQLSPRTEGGLTVQIVLPTI